ncbi:trypsin-like serine peptidase [Rhizobium yanglingense]
MHLFSTKKPEPDWHEAYKSGDVIRRLADPVAFLLTSGTSPSGDLESWTCTSVLVEDHTILTNWHCGGAKWLNSTLYWNSEVLSNCLLDFRWDGGTSSSQFGCGELITADPALDFALVKIEPLAAGAPLNSLPIPVEIAVGNEATSNLLVVHHARSLAKNLSRNCASVAEADRPQFFFHNCDTDPGASGAPVFDESDGRVIGLHHAGFERDKDCKVLARKNEAVSIMSIKEAACKELVVRAKLPRLCGTKG